MRVKELALLLISRVLILFSTGYVALTLVPNLAQFPYIEKISATFLPSWMYSWANFDGAHFISIASRGYQEFDQAFFPLYPLTIRLTHLLFQDYVLSGLIVSHISFAFGIYLFYRFVHDVWGTSTAIWSTFSLIAFPTAYYFSAVYTESLFLMLFFGSLYALIKKNRMVAGVLAFAGAFTRIQGVFILIPLALSYYSFSKPLKAQLKGLNVKDYLVLLSPLAGLATYMVYLHITTGDPLFFLTSQGAFGANRSSSLVLLPQVYYRYLKIFLTADVSFQYAVALSEFLFTTGALILACLFSWKAYVQKKSLDLGIGLFSLAYLILPTLTGTFSSMPRYALCAFATYLFLGQLKSPLLKTSIVIVFMFFQVLFTMLFIQGRFIA